MKQVKGNVLALDLYANSLQKQPTASFQAASEVNETLNNSSIANQNKARKNSAEWLDTLKPQMIQINEDILNYATRIKNFSAPMKKAIKENNVKQFGNGLKLLLKDSTAHKERVDTLLTSLREYRTKISTDTQNLKQNTTDLTAAVAGDNAAIGVLQKQLAAYNTAINGATTTIALGSTGIVTGVLLIVTGGVMLFTGAGEAFAVPVLAAGGLTLAGGIAGTVIDAKEMDDLRTNIKDGATKLSTLNQEVVGLNLVNSQVQNFTQNIDKAIDALQNLSNDWGSVSAKYTSLLGDIEDTQGQIQEKKGKEVIGAFAEAELDTVMDTWQAVAIQAGNIYIDTKYEDLKKS
ncbi:HBL/NHE enterotoxin family protein [Bacillus cereus]